MKHSEEYNAFTDAVRRIMSVPKAEILRREAEHKKQADVLWTSPMVDSVALTDQIRELDISRLGKKVGKLSRPSMMAVELGLTFLFEIR